MIRDGAWILVVAVIAAAPMRGAASATSTPCGAPEFRKVGEFVVPACGVPAGDSVKISGRVVVTNRAAAEVSQAMLIRKGKILALGAIAAKADNPTATDVSFEYTEPGARYQVPIDLVILPKCGPVLSISVDRPGRCQ